MVERCDGSSSVEVCLSQTETHEVHHEKRPKMAGREEPVAAAVLDDSPNIEVKTKRGEQTKMAKGGSFGGPCQTVEENHHQHPLGTHLMSNSRAEEGTPAAKPASEVLQNDCRDPAVMDNCGKANSLDNNVDFLPLSTPKGDLTQSGESVEAEQPVILPLKDQADINRQRGPDLTQSSQAAVTAESMEEKTSYHSVLRKMQQPQKLRGGRKVTCEYREVSGCSPAEISRAHVPKKQETVSKKRAKRSNIRSVTTKEEDTKITSENNELSGHGTGDTSSADAFQRRPRTASKKRRKLRKVSSVTLKEEEEPTEMASDSCELSGKSSAETSGVNVPQTRPDTASKRKRKLRKSGSVTRDKDKKITCENSELSGSSPAEISVVSTAKTRALKQKGRRRRSKFSGKKRKRRQTFIENTDVTTQDEPLLADRSSNQDTTVNGMDLNAAKREHHKSAKLQLKKGAVSSCLDEISPVGSALSAASSSKMMKRKRRRNVTRGTGRAKSRRARTRAADADMTACSLNSSACNSTSGDEMIEQKLTPKTKVKHSSKNSLHRRQAVKLQKPLRCSFCGRSFRHITAFAFHRRIHTVEKPHSCRTCGSCHVCLDSPRHNKPLRCSICLKEFLNRDALRMHRRTHGRNTCSVKKLGKSSRVNVQPYSCTVCFKGFVKLQDLKRHSRICSRCKKASSSFEDFAHVHQSNADGFLVSQSVEGRIVTPVFFKCPICKQLHRHWCQYTLHLRTHTHNEPDTCETCRQQHNKAAEMSHCMVCCRKSGEEGVCRSVLSDIWKEPETPEIQTLETHLDDTVGPPDEDQSGEISAVPQVEVGEKETAEMQSKTSLGGSSLSDISGPFPSPPADETSHQPSRFRPQSLILRHYSRCSCGRCRQTFSRWDKLWLHQRLHRQINRSFSCSRCELDFRFLGSYLDHLQEHAAQTPHACPLCPDAFANEENSSTHISECHKQRDLMKCNTCGKNFSTRRNLKKHKRLHKGSSSRRYASSSGTGALKTHQRRRTVPPVEPLLFSHRCSKCSAMLSSADLLQAHQVCHFTAGRNPESSTDSVGAYIPNRAPEDSQGVVSELSQRIWRLPVCDTKHLFRYPHPDHLYVVPGVSSETPVIVSDTEEHIQDQSQSTSNTGAGFIASDPSTSNLPWSLTGSSHEAGGSKNLQAHSGQPSSLQDQDSSDSTDDFGDSDSDSDGSLTELLLLFTDEKVHSCAICMEPFTDVSKLHEHYKDHARRM